MKLREEAKLVLIALFIVLVGICINQAATLRKWQNKYSEQLEWSVEQANQIEAMQTNYVGLQSRYNHLEAKYEKVSEWSRNTYCELTVGNAHIKFKESGNAVYRSQFYVYVDRELITRPPLSVVDCGGK